MPKNDIKRKYFKVYGQMTVSFDFEGLFCLQNDWWYSNLSLLPIFYCS